MLRTLHRAIRKNERVTRIISNVRKIIEENPSILNDEDVKRWLRLVYPLLLEHGSLGEKEFFKMIYTELFD